MNHTQHYGHLAAMVALSFVAMYVLMYAMVDVIGNVYPSLNQAYMAGLMTAPMIMIEIRLMGAMYGSKRLNALIVGASIALLSMCWLLIRRQVAIDDEQFLKSMIPHHGGAILMCEHASLEDPEIKALCERIRLSQQSEIDPGASRQTWGPPAARPRACPARGDQGG